METILGLCIGIGLSAACGFRVFVPLLVMSIASLMGWFEPMKGFEWLAMPSVCIALAVATVCEITAYYIPWVDNALDTISTPAAMIAGTLTTMAVSSGEMSQFASWAKCDHHRWWYSRRSTNEYRCRTWAFNRNHRGHCQPCCFYRGMDRRILTVYFVATCPRAGGHCGFNDGGLERALGST